ncbi:MAG: class I SAM-dependent methyltransferase [Verrucomicrobia bacterium]|nr:class I SAM-dependent methyltransferase [Verrucomicrobiota bacterium]
MYSLYDYSNMFADKVRADTYIRALESLITPESVIVDLGAGSGLFSLIACKLGARKVYAIEPSNCIQAGKTLAKDCGFGDRIDWIQNDSRKIQLKEQADIILSDIRGILPLIDNNIEVIADAKNRFLKNGGHILPIVDTLHIALVENSKLHQKCLSPWKNRNYGLELQFLSERHANYWCSVRPKQKHLVSKAEKWAAIDYASVKDPNFSNTVTLTAERSASVHGFYLWFDTEIAPGIGFSGGPGKIRPSVYGCAFFPWPEPVEMKAGDEVSVHVEASLIAGEYIWLWNTSGFSSSESGKEAFSFTQSSFQSEVTALAQLRKRAHSHVPKLSDDGALQSAVLHLMDGDRDLEVITRKLMAKYPERFSKFEEGLAFVGNISEEFSH